jgi:nicotinamidase/pyrazinamidase
MIHHINTDEPRKEPAMNAQLLIIDPQNDFCDIPGAALPVAGANADMLRLASLIQNNASKIDGITVTLDSHPSVAVERTTFWVSADEAEVPPFTFITASDVASGKYLPRDQTFTTAVLAMLNQLAAKGRPGLVVWPVHCVTGTWGHNIQESVTRQLQAWEFSRQRAVRKVLKGEYPLTEHFGVFEADAPIEGVESTQFNTRLAAALTEGVDLLFIAGEASSHCVASSFDQLVRYRCGNQGAGPRLVLLKDCMSPVTGFEAAASEFYGRAREAGAQLLDATSAANLLT